MPRRCRGNVSQFSTVDAHLARSPSALELRRRLERLGCLSEPIPPEAFVAYRYLASLDGAVSAWKRVSLFLASGSVLLLQHRWSQFFYPGLRPWEHYVPLKDDMSNLLARHAWLRAHGARARAIAENGRRFARSVLQPSALDDYLVEVMEACSMQVFT